jgi:hypothetical protein
MQVHLIDRPPDAFQQPVAVEQLLTLIDRAFGPDCVTTSIQELAGGSINNTYRICFANRPEVVLRIAPRVDHPQSFRHEGRLLRREYNVQPFLAPIANLVLHLRRMRHSNFSWLWGILQETVQTLQARSQL